jgi:soluble lytic murein transglycosylase
MVKSTLKHFLIILLALSVVVTATNFYYAYKYPIKFENAILAESNENNFNPNFICAVIAVESKFNKNALSSSGAVGIMQIMPTTAIEMADLMLIENFTLNQLYEAETNIRIGARYLRYLKDKFLSIRTVLASYNAGEGKVQEWLLDGRYSSDGITLESTPYKQTNAYISNVLRALRIYNNKAF